MSACPKCGSPLSGGEIECPACGVILAKVRPAPPRAAAIPDLSAPNPEAASVSGIYAGPDPASASGPQLTEATLRALAAVRPWLRFMVVYGFVMLALAAVGAGTALIASFFQPKLLAAALLYGLYSAVGFSIILPLHRSTEALSRIDQLGPSAAVEAFAIAQGVFWRRSGLAVAVMLVLVLLVLVLGALMSGLGLMGQLMK